MYKQKHLHFLLKISATAIVYFIFCKLGLSLSFEGSNASAIWPASGVAVAAVAIWGRAALVGVFIGALAVNGYSLHKLNISYLTSFLNSAVIAFGNTLEACLVVKLGLNLKSKNWPLGTTKKLVRFLLVTAFVAAPVAATFGAVSVGLFGTNIWVPVAQLFKVWWIGDFLGVIVFAPFFLCFFYRPLENIKKSAVIQMAVILSLGLTLYVFTFNPLFSVISPLSLSQFLVFPILFICVDRLGFHGLHVALVAIVLATVIQMFPVEAKVSIYSDSEVVLLSLFLMILSLIGLFLSSLTSEKSLLNKENIVYRRRYEALIEGYPDLIFLLNQKGDYVDIIASEEALLVNSAENLRHKNIFDVMPKENANEIYSVIKKTINEGPQVIKYDLEVPAGKKSFEGRTSKINREIDGLEPLIVWVSRDITEELENEKRQKELEQQVFQSQKMEAIALMAGGVAHDLNNLLSSVVTYPDIVKNKLPTDSPVMDYLDRIKDAGTKSAQIVKDLLTLSRKSNRESKVLNINDIINEFLQSLMVETLKKDYPFVELDTELSEQPLFVEGSSIHITKILMNLVINAFEAIEEHSGRVVIKSYLTEDKSVCFEVGDTGSGIDPLIKERIFDPFYSSKHLDKSGSGLGLAVAWGIVQDHQGEITVSSEVGKGAVFKVELPRSEKFPTLVKVKRLPVNVSRPEKNKNYKFLVVDDLEDQRFLMKVLIEGMGYTVDTASCGEEAVRLIKKQNYDLVILDMIMGKGWDGLDTYEKIIKINKNQKTIIMSGHAANERINRALNLGAVQAMTKPFTRDEFNSTLEQIL